MSGLFVARTWGVYTKPKQNEDRVIQELERRFPGFEWIEPDPVLQAAIMPAPQTGTDSTGKNLKAPFNVLANNGIVYPYGRFKGLKGTLLSKIEPPSASASSAPTSRVAGSRQKPGVTGAQYDYAVMGSSKVHGAALEKWLKTVPDTATIVCVKPRARKDGQPMNTEALLMELRPMTGVIEVREDLYAGKAEDVALETALRQAKTIVLIGTGKKVTYARSWVKRISQTSRYNNECQHITHKIPFDVVEVEVKS